MTKTPVSTDIAVVGGGLAGLLAACRLASTGRSVTLLAPPRREDRRTTALLGVSIDALKTAGIWQSLAPLSQALRAIRIVDGTSRLVRGPEVSFDASDVGLAALGYNVPNEPMLAALEATADAAGVRRISAMAKGVAAGRGHVRVDVDNGAPIHARLLVAADGQASPCRGFAGIAMKRTEIGQTAVVCNISHTEPHDDVSTEFHTETGPFTLVPLAVGRSALVWVTTPEEAERVVRMTPAELAEAIEAHSHALLGRVSVDGPAQAFKLATGIADRLSAERVVLIGEAAHVLPPIAAQGFNLTIRDIEALAGLIGDALVHLGQVQ